MKKFINSTIIAAALSVVSAFSFAIEAKVAASMEHTVFIDDGNVYGMGLNNYRQSDPATLTIAATYPYTSTEHVRVPVYIGIQNVYSVAAQGSRSAALTKDGKIYLWGQLTSHAWTKPYIPFTTSSPVTDIALTFTSMYAVSNGWLLSWNYNPSTAPTVVSTSGNVKSIVSGDKHLVVLHTDGTVSTIGDNAFGQLGRSASTGLDKVPGLTNIVEIAANTNTSLVRNAAGEVWGWGRNHQSQLGLGHTVNQFAPVLIPDTVGVKKITANYASTFFHMADNTVKAAGWHNYIAGSVYNVSKFFTVLPAITGALQVHAGGQQIFVDLGTPSQIRGWGGNSMGQLGDATNVERHTLTYAYFTKVAPATINASTGTCGSIYANPFSNAQASNKNGAECKAQGNATIKTAAIASTVKR